MKKSFRGYFLMILACSICLMNACSSEKKKEATNEPTSTSTPKEVVATENSTVSAIDETKKTINLVFPTVADNSLAYFQEIIEESLKAIGYTVTIKKMEPKAQTAIVGDLDQSVISMFWLVASTERNAKYTSVPVGLTNGVNGKRILFIKKGDQGSFDGIKTVDEFISKNKVAAMGKGWVDASIWKINKLQFLEIDGEWRDKIYKMIEQGGKGVDYFPRGLEILTEAKLHPELDIEKNLILQYESDVRCYLSKNSENMKKVLTEALIRAKESGLMDKTLEKYMGGAFKVLNFSNRTVIKLAGLTELNTGEGETPEELLSKYGNDYASEIAKRKAINPNDPSIKVLEKLRQEKIDRNPIVN